MKAFSKIIFLCGIIVLTAFGCEKNEDNDVEYINLETVGFYQLSDNEIVDSISSMLNLKNFDYVGITDRWEEDHGVAGLGWIKEGKKYLNIDGHSIILWNDSIDNLTTITYLNYRQSNSDNWSINEIQINDYINNILSSFGFIQKQNEECIINESACGVFKWYNVACNQTYKSDTLKFPEFISEIEGDTCKINYMLIPVWYTNMDSINSSVSFDELEKNAKNFFVSNYEGIIDKMESNGYWIVYNKLCIAFETRITGKRGTYRVFIDVQTSEVVLNTIL